MSKLSIPDVSAAQKSDNPSLSRAVTLTPELTAFHEVINYMVNLRRNGRLEDNTFAELISYAAATFIEAEVNRKITHIFDDKLTPEQIMRFIR